MRLLLLSPVLMLVWLAQLAWLGAGGLHAVAHRLAAAALGLEVTAVGLGVGPALARRGRWQLGPLPGAFVAVRLDDASPARVAAYLMAGPLGSVVAAWALVAMAYTVHGARGELVPQALPDEVLVIGEVFPGSPASAAGFEVGDTLLAVDGVPLAAWSELPGRLQPGPLAIRVQREGEAVDLIAEPDAYGERLVLGIARPPGPLERETFGPAEAAHRATAYVAGFFRGLRRLTGGAPPTSLGGPVAIVAAAEGRTAPPWALAVALLVATRSLVLAVYNVLPLPFSDALSGLDQFSRRLRGRPLPMKALNVAGGAMVLAGFLVVLAMDVLRMLGP